MDISHTQKLTHTQTLCSNRKTMQQHTALFLYALHSYRTTTANSHTVQSSFLNKWKIFSAQSILCEDQYTLFGLSSLFQVLCKGCCVPPSSLLLFPLAFDGRAVSCVYTQIQVFMPWMTSHSHSVSFENGLK